MIELQVGKKKYKIPSKIEEVTLRQWQDLNNTEEDKTEVESFANFSGIPFSKLKKANTKEVLYFIHQLNEMLSVENIGEPETPTSFKVKGVEYIVDQDIDNLPMAQYLDCTAYMQRLQGKEHEFYPYMMAIYCLKKGEKYSFTGDTLEKRAEIMRDCSFLEAYSINLFFLITSEVFRNATLQYLGVSQDMSKSKQE